MSDTLCYVPESVTRRGWYARKDAQPEKFLGETWYITPVIDSAIQFPTKEECDAFCLGWNTAQKANGSTGMFESTEHGYW